MPHDDVHCFIWLVSAMCTLPISPLTEMQRSESNKPLCNQVSILRGLVHGEPHLSFYISPEANGGDTLLSLKYSESSRSSSDRNFQTIEFPVWRIYWAHHPRMNNVIRYVLLGDVTDSVYHVHESWRSLYPAIRSSRDTPTLHWLASKYWIQISILCINVIQSFSKNEFIIFQT